MAEGLTARQSECLEFIASYVAEEGFSPTQKEISAALGIRARSGANRLILVLQQRGYISFRRHSARSIELTPKARGDLSDCCPTCRGEWLSFDQATRRAMRDIAERFHAKRAAKVAAE